MAKVEVKTQEEFKPVVLTITLESQQEVEALYAIGTASDYHKGLIANASSPNVYSRSIIDLTLKLFYQPLKTLISK